MPVTPASPMPPASPYPKVTPGRLAVGLGIVAWLAVVSTLAAPGITTDEPLDVRPGRTYVTALQVRGLRFFDRAVVDAVFRDNAEHPPLGRWLLGIASTMGQGYEASWRGADPVGIYVLSARIAPASAFAALVALIVHATARRYGNISGAAAGLSLLMMPRLFAHGHLGALDTFITLFWVAALFSAERALTTTRPVLMTGLAGAIWALALLTKIHAWFLIPIVLGWAVMRIGLKRGVLAWSAWLTTGVSLFYLGWPWLWFDTTRRLLTYFGTGVDRASIRVLYFGRVYADIDVPWHYPWFYFAATVPVGLHALGALGVWRGVKSLRADRFPLLLLSSMTLFLVLFSTRVPVYDGERLFLMVFPIWGVFVGRGFGMLWERADGSWLRKVALSAFLTAQAYGVVALHPFGLSYYNALVGGLPGAERFGLELTFWGDAVDRLLLDRLVLEAPAIADAALVPTLYPGQGIFSTTPEMAQRSVLLRDDYADRNASWVVVSRREAYWKPTFRDRMKTGRVVFERRRQGVWLSRIYAFRPTR